MTIDRLSQLVSAALRAQRKAAFMKPVERMPQALVDIICKRGPEPISIQIPQDSTVGDDDIRMAARNGDDAGLPPELLEEIRQIEEEDEMKNPPNDDHGR